MTMPDDDRDLRDRFAVLRREDERLVPGFRRGKPPRRVRFRGLALAGFAILLALAFLVGRYGNDRAPDESVVVEPSIGTWRSPTEFLLETPGRQLLETVPAVGRWPLDARQSSLPATDRPF